MGRLVYLPTHIYHKNQAFNVGKYTVQSSHGSVMGLKENDQLPSTDMVRRRGWAERPVMGNCDRPSSWGNPAVKMCEGLGGATNQSKKCGFKDFCCCFTAGQLGWKMNVFFF